MEKLSALIEGIQLSFKDEEFLTMAVDILNKGKEEPKDDMWFILQRQKNFHEACEFLDGIMKKMGSVELSENESEFVDIISDAILAKVKNSFNNRFIFLSFLFYYLNILSYYVLFVNI